MKSICTCGIPNETPKFPITSVGEGDFHFLRHVPYTVNLFAKGITDVERDTMLN
jgi:hypothetical protein